MGTEMRRYVMPIRSPEIRKRARLWTNWTARDFFYSISSHACGWVPDAFFSRFAGRLQSSFLPFKSHTNISFSVPQK